MGFLKDVRPTLRDVAEAACVSVCTASKVLSGKSDVSAERMRRVRDAAEKLGYRRNSIAADLRLTRPKSIGLVLPDLANYFFVELARLLENEALRNGYHMVLAHADENPARELERIRFVLSRQIAGMIVIPCRASDPAVDEIRKAKVPMVIVDRVDETSREHAVMIDNYRAAFEGTQHLLALGHRHIAFLVNTLDLVNSKQRADGYTDAMRNADLCREVDIVRGGMTAEEIHVATLRALHRPRRPSALFAGGNVATLGALRAIRDTELRMPEDVSLLSFDDAPWMSAIRPCLSAIRQPVEEIGHVTWELMWALINGNECGALHRKLKASLHVRESTAAPQRALVIP